jgi:hypothetical protein
MYVCMYVCMYRSLSGYIEVSKAHTHSSYMHAYMYTYLDTNTHTYTHTYIHTAEQELPRRYDQCSTVAAKETCRQSESFINRDTTKESGCVYAIYYG